jgi:hypothetical protein
MLVSYKIIDRTGEYIIVGNASQPPEVHVTNKPSSRRLADLRVNYSKPYNSWSQAKFSALYASGYKHDLTYKHAILGPKCMLIKRFYYIYFKLKPTILQIIKLKLVASQ